MTCALFKRLRQQELKGNPLGTFGDGINRTQLGSFADLVGGWGWKGTGILIILLVIGYAIYKLVF
ncbi:DUF6366 family protein [Paenibacillus sp. OK003]|uniref:DUF6366 family protein n=1 Tax=Paenibacillus sp. OK003 TaxID=1884380 RepID=UPI000B87BBA3|nr:DUF6366 family protein [Paenibacillus sp. OK003]